MLGSLNAARVDMLDGEEWNARMNCVAEEGAERWGKENKRLPEAAIFDLVSSKERRNHTNTLPAGLEITTASLLVRTTSKPNKPRASAGILKSLRACDNIPGYRRLLSVCGCYGEARSTPYKALIGTVSTS